jgi:hypothetical protein
MKIIWGRPSRAERREEYLACVGVPEPDWLSWSPPGWRLPTVSLDQKAKHALVQPPRTAGPASQRSGSERASQEREEAVTSSAPSDQQQHHRGRSCRRCFIHHTEQPCQHRASTTALASPSTRRSVGRRRLSAYMIGHPEWLRSLPLGTLTAFGMADLRRVGRALGLPSSYYRCTSRLLLSPSFLLWIGLVELYPSLPVDRSR